MPRSVRKVFISYTAEDLRKYAIKVREVVTEYAWAVSDHVDWAPNGVRSVAMCKQEVQGCDILVVLVAHRYGWIPPVEQGGDGKTSITQMEYQWAREFGKPVVPYLIKPSVKNWPDELIEWKKNPAVREPLDRFRKMLGEGCAGFFDRNPDSVTRKLLKGLLDAESLIGGDPEMPPRDEATLPAPAAAVSTRPEGLTYLCNRSDQSRLFKSVFATHLKVGSRRPLLFVVHGKLKEAHWPFVQRVTGRIMPETLEKSGGVAAFKTLELHEVEPAMRASFAAELRSKLADKLQEPDFADDAAIVEHLKRSRARGIVPVLYLRTSETRDPAGVVQGIHKFWSEFPDLPEQQFAVCFLIVQYDERLGGLDRVRALFGAGNTDARMRKAIEELEEEGRGDERASVYLLPELTSVKRSHILDWRTMVSDYLPNKHLPEGKLTKIFGESPTLEMEDAIEELQKLLDEKAQGA
jgi:hypothetical protein